MNSFFRVKNAVSSILKLYDPIRVKKPLGVCARIVIFQRETVFSRVRVFKPPIDLIPIIQKFDESFLIIPPGVILSDVKRLEQTAPDLQFLVIVREIIIPANHKLFGVSALIFLITFLQILFQYRAVFFQGLRNGLAENAVPILLNVFNENPVVVITVGVERLPEPRAQHALERSPGTGDVGDFRFRPLLPQKLNAKKGEIIGIVGESGCGKSTLLKLMLRFWEKGNGEIAYNGIDVDQINTSNLLDNVTMVSQSTYLFDETIEENLRIAKADATQEEMEKLLMLERKREFMFEGKRWFDLVRKSLRDGNTHYLANEATQKQKENAVAIKIQLADINAIFWPYNRDELKKNSLLKQNSAYSDTEDFKK